jgi:hypothetical protein
MKVHFRSDRDEFDPQIEHVNGLYPFVVDVWVYEVETRVEPHKPVENGMQTWYDDESDEEEESDGMFYVAELA